MNEPNQEDKSAGSRHQEAKVMAKSGPDSVSLSGRVNGLVQQSNLVQKTGNDPPSGTRSKLRSSLAVSSPARPAWPRAEALGNSPGPSSSSANWRQPSNTVPPSAGDAIWAGTLQLNSPLGPAKLEEGGGGWKPLGNHAAWNGVFPRRPQSSGPEANPSSSNGNGEAANNNWPER